MWSYLLEFFRPSLERFFTSAAGSLVGASLAVPNCHCDCHLTADPPDARVLELLRGQLERCGPERLAPAPAPPPSPITVVTQGLGVEVFISALALLSLGLVLGVLIGVYVVAPRLVHKGKVESCPPPLSSVCGQPDNPPTPKHYAPKAGQKSLGSAKALLNSSA